MRAHHQQYSTHHDHTMLDSLQTGSQRCIIVKPQCLFVLHTCLFRTRLEVTHLGLVVDAEWVVIEHEPEGVEQEDQRLTCLALA